MHGAGTTNTWALTAAISPTHNHHQSQVKSHNLNPTTIQNKQPEPDEYTYHNRNKLASQILPSTWRRAHFLELADKAISIGTPRAQLRCCKSYE